MAKKIPDIEAPVLPAEAVGEAVQAPTEPAEAAVKAPSAEAQPAEDGKSGIYMYIGPNIKGLIQTGTGDPKPTVDEMMAKMRASGFEDIVTEAQTQLDAFLGK